METYKYFPVVREKVSSFAKYVLDAVPDNDSYFKRSLLFRLKKGKNDKLREPSKRFSLLTACRLRLSLLLFFLLSPLTRQTPSLLQEIWNILLKVFLSFRKRRLFKEVSFKCGKTFMLKLMSTEHIVYRSVSEASNDDS